MVLTVSASSRSDGAWCDGRKCSDCLRKKCDSAFDRLALYRANNSAGSTTVSVHGMRGMQRARYACGSTTRERDHGRTGNPRTGGTPEEGDADIRRRRARCATGRRPELRGRNGQGLDESRRSERPSLRHAAHREAGRGRAERARLSGTFAGAPFAGSLRYTRSWGDTGDTGGKWRVVAAQCGLAPF
ncbi:hypothetical protein BYI23_B009590 [Burkholderia sp. YI23]|nr:hypothetical protein BYI23_B009590 [Burkholderia sp. YI23]